MRSTKPKCLMDTCVHRPNPLLPLPDPAMSCRPPSSTVLSCCRQRLAHRQPGDDDAGAHFALLPRVRVARIRLHQAARAVPEQARGVRHRALRVRR